MKTWRSPEILQGQLLWVSLAWAQYTAGTGVSNLEDTTTKLPHLESNYLLSLRDYLASTGGSLELKDDFVIAKQQDQDEFLMTVALDSKRFKPAQLKRINYCWMYINVLLVSGIATAKGDYIDSKMFLGEAQPMSTKHKVNQPKPNAKAWKQWRRLLLLITHTLPSLKLKTPMGQWLVQWNQLQCKWPFLFDASWDILLHHTSQGYTQHEKLWRDYDKNPSQGIIDPVISRQAGSTCQCHWIRSYITVAVGMATIGSTAGDRCNSTRNVFWFAPHNGAMGMETSLWCRILLWRATNSSPLRLLDVEISLQLTLVKLNSAELLEQHLLQLVVLQDEIFGVGFLKLWDQNEIYLVEPWEAVFACCCSNSHALIVICIHILTDSSASLNVVLYPMLLQPWLSSVIPRVPDLLLL